MLKLTKLKDESLEEFNKELMSTLKINTTLNEKKKFCIIIPSDQWDKILHQKNKLCDIIQFYVLLNNVIVTFTNEEAEISFFIKNAKLYESYQSLKKSTLKKEKALA